MICEGVGLTSMQCVLNSESEIEDSTQASDIRVLSINKKLDSVFLYRSLDFMHKGNIAKIKILTDDVFLLYFIKTAIIG